MAKIERFNGNLTAFAGGASAGKRTVFDSATESDSLDDNINPSFNLGWEIVGTNGVPKKQDYNALGFTLSQIHAYLHQAGVPEWNVNQEYYSTNIASLDGVLYVSIQDGVGKDPRTEYLYWDILAGGGDVKFLGIRYPKESTEYKNVGNLGDGSTANHYSIRGDWLPCITDTNHHLSVEISVATLASSISKRTNDGTVIWTVSTIYAVTYWCDPLTDDIYFSGQTLSPYNFFIRKIDFITGVVSDIFSESTVTNNIVIDRDFDAHLEPRDRNNLSTCVWDFVCEGNNVRDTYLISLDATLNTGVATALVYDIGGLNLPVQSPSAYVTLDHKIIMGLWTSGTATSGNRIVSFSVQRGSAKEYVEIPFDGNLPLVEGYIATPEDFAIESTNEGKTCRVVVVGDSVVFVAPTNDAAINGIVGKRLFIRSDFDRWLEAICDAYLMPVGEVYY